MYFVVMKDDVVINFTESFGLSFTPVTLIYLFILKFSASSGIHHAVSVLVWFHALE